MSFFINDESTWRVTAESPVRELEAMDWERCSALHNHIIELGWNGMGNTPELMPKVTWWKDRITTEALEEEWTRRLSPSLKLFLQHAWMTPHDNFFYYVSGLNWPEALFSPLYEEDDVVVTLYRMRNLNFGGHREGLTFNQETNLAIFCDDILDSRATTNGRMIWDPLEEVLTQWLDMIDAGKVVIRPKDTTAMGPWETSPWELKPYSEVQLEHAITYFNFLITRIEILLENPSLRPLNNPVDQAMLQSLESARLSEPVSEDQLGIVSKEFLDKAKIPEGFTREFLSRVRRPKGGIKYIAPGLRIPTENDFEPYVFQDFNHPGSDDDTILPIPLFITDLAAPESFMPYPFHEVRGLHHGLWMETFWKLSHHIFEDSCRLYLPFDIGGNSFARLTDDSLIGENLEARGEGRGAGRRNELYQPGYCHFIPRHGPSLGDVLELWANMVGLGEWEVNEHGVKDTIEKFKDADIEEGCFKYQLLAMKW